MAVNSLGILLRAGRWHTDTLMKNMADYCGMSSARLSSIEHGKEEPTPDELDSMAAFIAGVSPVRLKARKAERERLSRDYRRDFPRGDAHTGERDD